MAAAVQSPPKRASRRDVCTVRPDRPTLISPARSDWTRVREDPSRSDGWSTAGPKGHHVLLGQLLTVNRDVLQGTSHYTLVKWPPDHGEVAGLARCAGEGGRAATAAAQQRNR